MTDKAPRRFRKRPVEIEAMQFTGMVSVTAIVDWVLANGGTARWRDSDPADEYPHGRLAIDTLEGTMLGDFGDWIIRGVKGEFYPCKPDIFRQSYEADDGMWCVGCGDLLGYDQNGRLPEGTRYDVEGEAVCASCATEEEVVRDA